MRDKMMVKYDSDDLIYNRFDLIYSGNYEEETYEYNGKLYVVQTYINKGNAYINVWGKKFPEKLFGLIIDNIFLEHSDVLQIIITKAYNNYRGEMYETEDIVLPLPESKDELLNLIKTKHRYNLRRNRARIEKILGDISTVNYTKGEIPDDIVNDFFKWKAETYGTNYELSEKAYLEKYHVTDCITVRAGDKPISILFYCKVNNIVYLENLSYDRELQKFSPGFLGYEIMLEELIKQKCKRLYLGGGSYSYKRYFGTIVNIAYSGNIYSNRFYKLVNRFTQTMGIKNFAIYGVGAFGTSFLKNVSKLDSNLSYCIDKLPKEIEGVTVYTLQETLPAVDAVFITLKVHNQEVENYLNERFRQVYYWIDLPYQLYDGTRDL